MAKTSSKLTISVIGLGYIGLPTACLMAKAGNIVYGYDIDEKKLGMLNKGLVPFQEKGLQSLLKQVIASKKFFVDNVIKQSDVYLIAVPTPDVHHKADLTFVFQAVQSIIPYLREQSLVIIESTIPPLACEKLILPMFKKLKNHILLAHCPERAIPGSTLREMVENDRIVGGITPLAAEKTATLYRQFVKGKVYTTNATTAECCKVMENTFRDVNIALANEFTKIADEIGINVWEAISLANKHPRVNIHSPGPGVGGHCIPVDPWFFVGLSKQAHLIQTARNINDDMPRYVVKSVLSLAKKHGILNPAIGILGVAYKKNVDDARETPATEIIKLFKKRGCKVRIHDPYVSRFSEKLDIYEEVLAKSQVLVLITDHDQYDQLTIKKESQIRFIFDTRNVLDAQKMSCPIYTLGMRKECV